MDPNAASALRHYRTLLVGDPRLDVAMCWVAVTTSCKEPQEIADRLRGHPHTPLYGPVPPWEVPADGPPHPSIGSVRDGMGIFEQNGFLAASPESLCRVSVDGKACGIYWDVEGNNRLIFAASGRVLLSIDAMEPGDRDRRPVAEVALGVAALEEIVADNEEEWQQGALVAAELYTGIRLTQHWLERRHPYAVLIQPPAPAPSTPTQTDPDALLRRWFANAAAPTQWVALRKLADELRARFELAEFPITDDIRDGLLRNQAFRDGGRLREELIWPLVRAWREREDEAPQEEDPRWRRMQAGTTLKIMAGGPGHRSHGFDAFHHAILAFGEEWVNVRTELLRILN